MIFLLLAGVALYRGHWRARWVLAAGLTLDVIGLLLFGVVAIGARSTSAFWAVLLAGVELALVVSILRSSNVAALAASRRSKELE